MARLYSGRSGSAAAGVPWVTGTTCPFSVGTTGWKWPAAPRSLARWAAQACSLQLVGDALLQGTQRVSRLGRQVSGLHVPSRVCVRACARACVCPYQDPRRQGSVGKALIQEAGEQAPIWTHH